MNFTNGFERAISHVLTKHGRGRSIALWHTVMRANIERFARERGITKLSFGYHHEDLVASIFRSHTLGVLYGESAQLKSWGDFQIISPLWAITKKELTLYLKLIAPKHHSQQGSPTDFDRGDHNRDINYFMADLLSSVYPGIGHAYFESLERVMLNYDIPSPTYSVCANCGITYSDVFRVSRKTYKHVCSHCSQLMDMGEVPRMCVVQ